MGKDVREGKRVPYQIPRARGFTAEAAQTVRFCPVILWCKKITGQVSWLHAFGSVGTAYLI